MSSSNYRRNEAAIRKFRKELMDMVDSLLFLSLGREGGRRA